MTRVNSDVSSKKKTTASRGQLKKRQNGLAKTAFTKSDLILIPLIMMIVACIGIITFKAYALNNLLTPSFSTVLWYPPFPALFIAMFGAMYVYKILKRERISGVARMVAYGLLCLFALFVSIVVAITLGKGYFCPDFSGASADCSQMSVTVLYVLFANPFSLVILSVVAVVGGVSLLVKTKLSIKK